MGSQYLVVTSAAVAWRKSFCRFVASRDEGIGGTAAIEFAIITSVVLMMMICVVDIGMGFYRKMQVQNAAQTGAEYAMLHGYNATSIASAVTAATTFTGISASPTPTQYCGCASNSGITSITCSSTCADGSQPATYVSVSAQGTYNTILTYPLIPSTFTLTAQSTVRTQ
jgi:Flp pilus assembly protein TadG